MERKRRLSAIEDIGGNADAVDRVVHSGGRVGDTGQCADKRVDMCRVYVWCRQQQLMFTSGAEYPVLLEYRYGYSKHQVYTSCVGLGQAKILYQHCSRANCCCFARGKTRVRLWVVLIPSVAFGAYT